MRAGCPRRWGCSPRSAPGRSAGPSARPPPWRRWRCCTAPSARTCSAPDRVTLGRALLAGGVAALVAERAQEPVLLVGLAVVALSLDWVDGRVARRTGTASEVGARFDMEVDAFLILVLSVHAAFLVGPWVLLIGAMRYLFVAASWLAPWLRAPLPPSTARKAVAVAQGIALVVVAAWPVAAVAAAALGALAWSFGRDVRWLWRRRAPLTSNEGMSHV
ncbi:CDP-alcohol phosphatidyltransferase family protein [Actinokineospora soli]|uniref:CDP-alcohol phosphatidyltransferase family protein n=1 Tax=Actinokineospora soli TaxID=1048753 RepID=A0ABW2TSN0_9PSEU